MSMILSFRPKFRELRLFLHNLVYGSAIDQPFLIKNDRTFHPIIHFARRFSHQPKSPALNFKHVFEPRFDPTANGNIAAHLGLFVVRFRNQRRKTAAIADAQHVNSARVDEIVVLQRAKRRAVTGQLRIEIRFAANAFAVTHSLFVHAKQSESRHLRETAKH